MVFASLELAKNHAFILLMENARGTLDHVGLYIFFYLTSIVSGLLFLAIKWMMFCSLLVKALILAPVSNRNLMALLLPLAAATSRGVCFSRSIPSRFTLSLKRVHFNRRD